MKQGASRPPFVRDTRRLVRSGGVWGTADLRSAVQTEDRARPGNNDTPRRVTHPAESRVFVRIYTETNFFDLFIFFPFFSFLTKYLN